MRAVSASSSAAYIAPAESCPMAHQRVVLPTVTRRSA